jgi:hypothetical protein
MLILALRLLRCQPPGRFHVTGAALADVETGKVKYFEGTPIPTSIVIVALRGVAADGSTTTCGSACIPSVPRRCIRCRCSMA